MDEQYLYAVKLLIEYLDEKGEPATPLPGVDFLAVCMTKEKAFELITKEHDEYIDVLNSDDEIKGDIEFKDEKLHDGWLYKTTITKHKDINPAELEMLLGVKSVVTWIGCERFVADRISEMYDEDDESEENDEDCEDKSRAEGEFTF